jgi:hypothetical protein
VSANSPQLPDGVDELNERRVNLRGQRDDGSDCEAPPTEPRFTYQYIYSSHQDSFRLVLLDVWLVRSVPVAVQHPAKSFYQLHSMFWQPAERRLTRPTYEAPTTMMFLIVEAMIWWLLGNQNQRSIRTLNKDYDHQSRRCRGLYIVSDPPASLHASGTSDHVGPGLESQPFDV